MQTPNASDDTSWWDDLIAGLSQKQVPPPPAPQPPPVNQSAWEKSVALIVRNMLVPPHQSNLLTRPYETRPLELPINPR